MIIEAMNLMRNMAFAASLLAQEGPVRTENCIKYHDIWTCQYSPRVLHLANDGSLYLTDEGVHAIAWEIDQKCVTLDISAEEENGRRSLFFVVREPNCIDLLFVEPKPKPSPIEWI